MLLRWLESAKNEVMKKTLWLISMLIYLTSCDRSGSYRLIDIEIRDSKISQEEMEREKAKIVGEVICTIKKVGDSYKMISDDDPDAILFTKGDDGMYSAHNGMMKLEFTIKGAILTAEDKENNRFGKWIFEKE